MTSFVWLRFDGPICAAGLPSHIWLSRSKPRPLAPALSPSQSLRGISLPRSASSLSLQYSPVAASALCHNSARWLRRSVNQPTTDLRRCWHMLSPVLWFLLQPQGARSINRGGMYPKCRTKRPRTACLLMDRDSKHRCERKKTHQDRCTQP